LVNDIKKAVDSWQKQNLNVDTEPWRAFDNWGGVVHLVKAVRSPGELEANLSPEYAIMGILADNELWGKRERLRGKNREDFFEYIVSYESQPETWVFPYPDLRPIKPIEDEWSNRVIFTDSPEIDTLDEYKKRLIAAIKALGQIKDIKAIPALTELLRDEDLKVRKAVICTLGKIGGRVAVLRLLKISQGEDKDIRITAIEALGETRDTKAVERLKETLQDVSKRKYGEENERIGVATVKALKKTWMRSTDDSIEKFLQEIWWNVPSSAVRNEIKPKELDGEIRGLFIPRISRGPGAPRAPRHLR
jgi:hypothetical protein